MKPGAYQIGCSFVASATYDRVLREFVTHCNHECPHRGNDHQPPVPSLALQKFECGNAVEQVDRLGGLLHETASPPDPALATAAGCKIPAQIPRLAASGHLMPAYSTASSTLPASISDPTDRLIASLHSSRSTVSRSFHFSSMTTPSQSRPE